MGWQRSLSLSLAIPVGVGILLSYLNLTPAQLGAITLGSHFADSCRCFPGDDCWPSKAEWDRFNRTTGGRLIATVPLASVCHNEGPLPYSEDACADLKSRWMIHETHIETPSSILAPFYTNNSCSPFQPRGSCRISPLVEYAVDTGDITHYQKTLAFVKYHNIRLVIRNTGHDYYGKSSGAGALAIWTHHLKSKEIMDWKSDGYTGKAVKMGAGVQAGELWEFLQKRGYVTPAGHCHTVGVAGGYTQGGGSGPLASAFGLGADQVLEWEVVASSGQLLKVNQNENQDLYWALSGGGGGTYAVVWSLTSKIYPDRRSSAGDLIFSSNSTNQEAFFDVVDTFIANLPKMNHAGLSTLWFIIGNKFLMQPSYGPGVSKSDLQNLLAPTLEKLKQHSISYESRIEEFPTFLEAFKALTPSHATPPVQIGGRLIPKALVTENREAIMNSIRNLLGKGAAVSGMAVDVGRHSSIPDNAVEPAWRESVMSLTTGFFWNQNDWNLNIRNQKLLTHELIPELDRITPNGLSYLNEGDPNQPKWQHVFYGRNYGKLLEIKKRYDPDSIFYGHTAVGSEEWTVSADEGRLCKASWIRQWRTSFTTAIKAFHVT